MTVQFYDVKNRQKVDVPVASVKRVKYERTTKNGKHQVRYAVKAEYEGRKLTKFVSQDLWNQLAEEHNVPEM